MSQLGRVVESVQDYNKFVAKQVERARADKAFAQPLVKRWRKIRENVETTTSPTGTVVPRLALPLTDEAGEVARYIFGEGLPGEFPFANAAYREMYLEEKSEIQNPKSEGNPKAAKAAIVEEPMRLFAGLGLAEDTNERFHYLSKHQKSVRLSTAFDGVTLYGLDCDHEGVLGKVGEGGVSVSSVEDMERLYKGFDLADKNSSVSMTINAPAPIILAMFVAAAKRRFGAGVAETLRGTIQADILKEVQAQNEVIFPTEASLRFLTDMAEYTTAHMPRWYPISISGYHIAEAGATPVQQAAFTLSNGFAYVEMFKARGMDVNQFGPRLSFFLDCGLDIEYLVLGRVCRRIWAIGMRDAFKADTRAQVLKLHTQTSGRSLIAAEFKNNLTRTAVELMIAYMNYTNSCHSNSADEPFTTPTEEYVRLASHGQSIILEESGLFKYMMNAFGGSPGLQILERQVEARILEVFSEIERLGGVLAAQEQRYQRSQIQQAAHAYETQIYSTGQRPIIGLNKYASDEKIPDMPLSRTPLAKQKLAVARLRDFKRKNAKKSPAALQRLQNVCNSGGNVFAELLNAVEVCSLGQITECLHGCVGKFRPMV